MPASTLLLIHGAFMNARCWDSFRGRWEALGHTVLCPSWPLLDGEPSVLRANPPAGLGAVGLDEIVAHYAAVIAALPAPPILVGHSFGGLVVQLLLDKGLGAAGVAIHPAPPRGIPPSMRTAISNFPVLSGALLGRNVHVMSKESFADSFANTLPVEEANAAWERYVVPTPARPFLQGATLSASTAVRWDRPDRAPLLLFAGGRDRSVTAGMNRSNKAAYRSGTVELREYPERDHFTIAAPGWEEIADAALGWALEHARGASMPAASAS
jgi:pimeloyl-ACP methyl ester carboxylesterase